MRNHAPTPRRRRALIATLVAIAAVALPAIAMAHHGGSLNPPTNLAAAAGNQQVHLSWTASTSKGVGGYRVYRQNPDGTWPTTPLATTTASTTSYTDTGLTNGTSYTYRVTTINTANPPSESAPSNTASATPAAPPPGPCG